MRCHICLSSPGLAASAAASTVDAGLDCIFKSPKPEEAHSTEEEEEEERSGTRTHTLFCFSSRATTIVERRSCSKRYSTVQPIAPFH